MNSKNTMSKMGYILSNCTWGVISMIWYRALLFQPLENLTVSRSKWILWGLLAAMIFAGIAVTFRRHRNYANVFINVLLPYEIYAAISYWDYFTLWISITVLVSISLSLVFYLLIVFHDFRNVRGREDAYRVMMNRSNRGFSFARVITTFCLCAFVLPVAANSLFGGDLFYADDGDTLVYTEAEKWTIANQMETVRKLKPDVWKGLSLEERLEVLSVVKNIELNYLGIHHEVYLTADNVEENTIGSFIASERKITLDIEHLKNSPVNEVLHTLLHECHHVYAHQQVEAYQQLPEEYKNLLLFYNAKQYEKEFADYENGNDDYISYASQYCERHADSYADDGVEDYYKRIFEYEASL